tara:strand:- start:1257 stop:1421 length:165 start_codon:yes stop_codon:yes gene_type:complete
VYYRREEEPAQEGPVEQEEQPAQEGPVEQEEQPARGELPVLLHHPHRPRAQEVE